MSLKRALAVEFYATQNPGTSLRSAHVSTAGSVVSQTQVTRYQTLLPSRVAPERKRDQTTFSQMAETVVSQFQSRDWETDLWLLVTPTMGGQLAVQPHLRASAQAILKNVRGRFAAWQNLSMD